MRLCKCLDCPEDNKCNTCPQKEECDYPWVSKLWNNTQNLSPCIPGWVKPEFKNNHVVTETGKHDFCVFSIPSKKDHVVIQELAVSEEARGQGLSKKLIFGLAEKYDRDLLAKCIKGSSADSFWAHFGEKIAEEPSKQSTLCIYYVKNKNKRQEKEELF